ncbi:MAG: glycosyltransferase family 4 protein [Chloroflexi bacterium]|nr:glycosyltransferase family 4 protein [Chloroflexota bacterium]MCL5075279.1 glycosyltransferase family 4 protein [Chloroflexota bacterium]
MNILMIAPEPFFQPRGTPFSIYSRLRALSALGHKIDLVTYHIGQNIQIEGVQIHRAYPIPFIHRVKPGPSYKKALLDIPLFIKALALLSRKRYDYIHAHEEAIFFGAIAAKLFNTPYLYDMHSDLAEQLLNFDFTTNRFILSLVKTVQGWVIKDADVVITISRDLEDRVNLLYRSKRAVLIENIAVELNGPAGQEEMWRLREEFRLEDRAIVLYTGTFEPYQGLDLLIRSLPLVAERHPEVIYLLVGGEPAQIEALAQLAEHVGQGERVIFAGSRPVSEMAAFMELAHILVSPRSSGTNTPLKIYSYLQSGKPIIATNLPTHTQALNSSAALLVEPTEQALAEGIIRLLEDANLREELGRKGKTFNESRYNSQSFLIKVKEICDYLESKRHAKFP